MRVQQRLGLIAPVTITLIALMLWLALKRGVDVVIVLASLPVALAGGVWLLWWLDYHFSVAVAVGFIALGGVAIETAIVMLVYLNLALQRRRDAAATAGRALTRDDLDDAIVEGALLRLRPKVMTVATIFAGLLPIMVGQGTGSELMRRIAAPMVGGMVSATLLTLLVVPVAFLLWHRARPSRLAVRPAAPEPLPFDHPKPTA
jgi:Cu(I)/Ag(I) efflux system membrane protein CusA/SilA